MPFAPSGRPAQGLDESRRRCGPPDAGRGEARHSHDGAYWQAFGRKKQARVACRPVSRRAPLGRCSKGEASRIVPWCEARSERPPLFRRASPPVPSLPLTLRERAAPLRTRRLIVARTSRRRKPGHTQTPQTAQQPPWIGQQGICGCESGAGVDPRARRSRGRSRRTHRLD